MYIMWKQNEKKIRVDQLWMNVKCKRQTSIVKVKLAIGAI